jgi:hypothetical protein
MCQQRAINLNGHYKGYTYYYDETTPWKRRSQQDKVSPGATHFLLYPILAETNFITLIKAGNVSNHNTVACTLLWEKPVTITYYECVFVALGIQQTMHMRHAVICGLSDSIIFFHIIS